MGFKERFFEVVAEGYPGDLFPQSYEEATRHENGDTLSDFIRCELEEGVDWGEEDTDAIIDKAVWLIERAEEDLWHTKLAILKLKEGG
jgi:hypothetical protein